MDIQTVSKFLSYILRHHPEEIGIKVDKNGWVRISELITQSQKHGKPLNRQIIGQVSLEGIKKRFIISEDKQYIRAGYGHSIDVDLQLRAKNPPEKLYHGTAQKHITSILAEGIEARSRNFVHLSTTVDEAQQVGGRHGTPQILVVQSQLMQVKGYDFYQSESEKSIWLTKYVPPKFVQNGNSMKKLKYDPIF